MSKLTVVQKRSSIGSTKTQKRILSALGLTKINTSIEHNPTPQVMGMIEKVAHLVEVQQHQTPKK